MSELEVFLESNRVNDHLMFIGAEVEGVDSRREFRMDAIESFSLLAMLWTSETDTGGV
jgi:hypothetical protein